MARFDVCVCGSVNVDLVFRVEELPRPGATVASHHFEMRQGGKGANQAVACSRFGGRVSFVGRCGKDEYGRLTRAALEAEEIATDALLEEELPTGVAAVLVADDAENSIVIASGANAGVAAGSDWPRGKVWVTQAEVPVAAIEEVLRTARAQQALAILNPSPAGIVPPELIAEFDLVVVNEDEYEQIADGTQLVIRTEGANGASILPRGTSIPAHTVEATDSTGAGDAFVGALAAGLANGDELERAVRLGVAAASISVSEGKGQAGYPSRAQAESLLVGAASATSENRKEPGRG